MVLRSPCLTSAIVLAVSLWPARGHADDRAIAQQAFQEGRQLMAAGKFTEACPKFAAAAQLSQTPGVRLNLAECYGKLGKTASAWAKANEALAIAERTGDAAAAALARTQLAALQSKLCYLTILVDKEKPTQGLEVQLDGEKLPAAVWGTSLPVDPGDHEITATAPGHKSSSTKASLSAENAKATVSVPALAAEDEPSAAPSGSSAAPEPDSTSDTSGGGWSRGTAHTLALVSGGLGIVGIGFGTAFGLDANSKKASYQQHEANGRCVDAQCATISQGALTSATISTVAFIAGGALVAAGAVLWLTAPAGAEQHAEGSVAVVPVAGPSAWGAGVSGSF
jgi:hypothetical protein